MEYKHLTEALSEVGKYVTDTYKEKLKSGGVYATGKLYNSVKYRIEVLENRLHFEFEAEDYWINIEEGRAAGSKMPPVEQIRKWMIAKGIPDMPGTAYTIARSIGKKGIKPKPYLRETIANIDQYKPRLREALELDIKEHTDKKIKGNIKKNIKN